VTTIDLTATGDAVVRDLPHEQYLAHPALSSSGAKVLVRPGGPARYAYERTHPRPPKAAFDLGHAAHDAVLGVGPVIVVVDAADWRTKAAQEERRLAYAAGRVPLLIGDAARVADMADALRAHPVARRLLHTATGQPEVSLFWHDPEHDVDRRGRVDFLRQPDADGRLILVDYKSTGTGADPDTLARAVINYGYHGQAAWYRDLVIGLGLCSSAPFVFVFQETTAPYLVHCVELDPDLLAMGADRNQRALSIFAECTRTGVWPGYNDTGITQLTAPGWALRQHEDNLQDAAAGDES
jgi:hypothetical protein